MKRLMLRNIFRLVSCDDQDTVYENVDLYAEDGVIRAVGGEGILRCRLLDMGLIPRTRVTVVKIAPMGDPMEIRLRGDELTLRLDDAAQIELEPEVQK